MEPDLLVKLDQLHVVFIWISLFIIGTFVGSICREIISYIKERRKKNDSKSKK